MMNVMAAVLVLSTAAWAQQDPPREGDKPRPEGRSEGDRPRPPRPPGPREGDQPRPPGPRDGDPRPPGVPRDGGPRPPGSPEGAPGRRPVPQFNPEEVRGWLKDNEPGTLR